jgi:hypothetical protein
VVGCLSEGAIPIGPGRGGIFCVIVVENIVTQEVGYLLDEALGKSRSLVCGLVIAVDMIAIQFWISASWVMKYSWAKAGEPTGDPRRRKPVVSLAGRGEPRTSMSFGLVEYWEIVSAMEGASVGLRWKRSGIGEWPEVEVRMRVFIGLTKHPSGVPMVANWSQRNCKSASGTQTETLSTYPRRCVMPPKPSLPGSLLRSRVVALSRSSMSSGWRRLAMTRDAKMGESGQPWLMPSSMSRVRHVPSAHLWWTVPACL